jgi:NADH-quinone oxidoreductase subunit L
MSYVLVVLAVGAALAGLVGIPKALGGGNVIESFLEPSFVAEVARETGAAPVTSGSAVAPAGELTAAALSAPGHASAVEGEAGAAHLSRTGEIGLMGLSFLVGILGIWVAHRFYVRRPEIADRLAARFATAHRILSNKYYVDELYGATVVRGTLGSADGLWTFDRTVVDGAVNGSGWVTIFTSWLSHLIDKYLVDGLVNLLGAVIERSSFVFRRVQTGLVQNYALLMLFGIFAFVSLYLMLRR